MLHSTLAFLITFPLTILVLAASALDCDADALPTSALFGASILSIDTTLVVDSALSFCNVSVVYTHPGQNDEITVWLWLPSIWNGRFQGVGGSGWTTGLIPATMQRAVSDGYAAVSTNGGHGSAATTASWGLLSPGNVNLYALQNFASVALNDMTVLGKQLTEAYYKTPILKSYWNGCSTGGRQGLMMAQRYPDAYDGILANAPAINWAEFVPSEFWPQRVMHEVGCFPEQCELQAITAAAVKACDALDGLEDGVIGLNGICDFEAASAVGQPYACGEVSGNITEQAAAIAQSIWAGPRKADGEFQWHGLAYDAPFSDLANTTCANGTCVGVPFRITRDWIRVFLQRDEAFDAYAMTQAEWDANFYDSKHRYTSLISANDPDLSAFKTAGGKMITWHGIADGKISPNGTVDYYRRVLARDANAADFYRVYMAPGAGHCRDGIGAIPTDPLAALVRWVEEGDAPSTLAANRTVMGKRWEQDVCAYPLVSMYVGGEASDAASFVCR